VDRTARSSGRQKKAKIDYDDDDDDARRASGGDFDGRHVAGTARTTAQPDDVRHVTFVI